MERAIMEQYRSSSRRLFLLDYDGTLAAFTAKPKNARLTKTQYETLRDLCGNPQNMVVIISGRDRHTLDDWLAHLPINLVAEYGHLTKEQGGDWHIHGSRNDAWKKAIRPVLTLLLDAVPGSYIEEKEFSLVWHYWDIDDRTADVATQEVATKLTDLATEFELAILTGTKVLEVTVPGVDKAVIAKRWIAKRDWDFILTAGDDVADENLFQAAPKQAFTIKIGPGESIAQYRLPSPQAFSTLLNHLNRLP